MKTKKTGQLKVTTRLRAGINLDRVSGNLQKLAADVSDVTQTKLGDATLLMGEDLV